MLQHHRAYEFKLYEARWQDRPAKAARSCRGVAALAFGALLSACAGATYPSRIPARPVIAPNRPRPATVFQPPTSLSLCPRARAPLGRMAGADGTILGFQPFIFTSAGTLLRAPVDKACLSSPFGPRPGVGAGAHHNGVDLSNAQSGSVRAAGDGWVTFAGFDGDYGLKVVIAHGRGVETLYAHFSADAPLPPLGMWVYRGEVIGRMGRTGDATGIHLHYEVHVDGAAVDPMNYGPAPAGA